MTVSKLNEKILLNNLSVIKYKLSELGGLYTELINNEKGSLLINNKIVDETSQNSVNDDINSIIYSITTDIVPNIRSRI